MRSLNMTDLRFVSDPKSMLYIYGLVLDYTECLNWRRALISQIPMQLKPVAVAPLFPRKLKIKLTG